VILLHNLGALLVLPLIGIFLIYGYLRFHPSAHHWSRWACLCVAAFQVLPFLLEHNTIQLSNASSIYVPAITRSRPPRCWLPRGIRYWAGPNNASDRNRTPARTEHGCRQRHNLATVAQQTQPEALLVGIWSSPVYRILPAMDIATPLWKAFPALNVVQFRCACCCRWIISAVS